MQGHPAQGFLRHSRTRIVYLHLHVTTCHNARYPKGTIQGCWWRIEMAPPSGIASRALNARFSKKVSNCGACASNDCRLSARFALNPMLEMFARRKTNSKPVARRKEQ